MGLQRAPRTLLNASGTRSRRGLGVSQPLLGVSRASLGRYLGLLSVSWSLWGRFGLDLEAIFVELGTYLDHLEGLGRCNCLISFNLSYYFVQP